MLNLGGNLLQMSKLGMSLAYFSIIVFLKTCSTNQGISGWSKGSCAYRSRMGAQTWDAKLRKTLKNCASGLSKLSHHSPFIAFHSCNKAYIPTYGFITMVL